MSQQNGIKSEPQFSSWVIYVGCLPQIAIAVYIVLMH